MKIVHWDEMFHPTFGYQINLLAKYQAMQGHEVVVLTSDNIENHPTFKGFANDVDIESWDRKYEKETGVCIKRLPIHGVFSGRVIYKHGFIDKINEEKPDILFCHTNDTLSGIIIARQHKKINCPLIFDNHMLDMASANKLSGLFRRFFRAHVAPVYAKNKWIVFRTQDDKYVNHRLGIPEAQTPFLSFGSDLERFKPDVQMKNQKREELGIDQDSFVVIYAGKINGAKGGKILSKSTKKKFNTDKKIVFLIIGNTPEEDIEKDFEQSENTILRLPTQNYVDLPAFYQCADLAVFPKQVSLSFFDVQATGLPVVAASNNINDERLAHNNGLTYELGDVEGFRNCIEKFANMTTEEFASYQLAGRHYIEKNFNYYDIAMQCTEILEKERLRQMKEGL